MKRKNLILDDVLLQEAKTALNAATESETVNIALREMIRVAKIRDLSRFFGTDLWQGSLSTMRDDRTAAPKKSRTRAS